MELTESMAKGIISVSPSDSFEFKSGRSLTAIYKGCNLRCGYCPESKWAKAFDTGFLPSRKIAKVVEDFKSNGGDQLVLGGAEPTYYANVIDFSYYLARMGFNKIFLKTNGMRPAIIERVKWQKLALYIHATSCNYPSKLEAPGSVQARLTESLRIIKKAGDLAEVVIVCAPGLIGEKEISEMRRSLEGVSRVVLERWRPYGEMYKPNELGEPYDQEEMRRLKRILDSTVESVQIRWSV